MAAAAIRCAHAGVIPWVPHASSVSSNEAKAELDAAAALDEAEAGEVVVDRIEVVLPVPREFDCSGATALGL